MRGKEGMGLKRNGDIETKGEARRGRRTKRGSVCRSDATPVMW